MKKRVLIILECLLIMTVFVTTAVPVNAEGRVTYYLFENGVLTSEYSMSEGDLCAMFNMPSGETPTGIYLSNGNLVLENAKLYDFEITGSPDSKRIKVVLKGSSTIEMLDHELMVTAMQITPRYTKDMGSTFTVEIVAEKDARLTLVGGLLIAALDGTYVSNGKTEVMYYTDSELVLGENTSTNISALKHYITSQNELTHKQFGTVMFYYKEPTAATTAAYTTSSTTTKSTSSQQTTKKANFVTSTESVVKDENVTTEIAVEEQASEQNTSTKIEITTKATPQPVENESNTGKIIGICIGATAVIGGGTALFFFVIKPKFL